MSQSIHIEYLQPSIPGPLAEVCENWLIMIRIVVEVTVNASCCLSLQRLNKEAGVRSHKLIEPRHMTS